MSQSVNLGSAHVVFTGEFAAVIAGLRGIDNQARNTSRNLQRESKNVQSTFQGMATGMIFSMKAFGNTLEFVRGKLRDVTKQLVFLQLDVGHIANQMRYLALASTAAFGAISAASLQFEKSFVGLRKVIDETDAGFHRIEQNIKRLSTTIAIGTTDLNELAAVAGRLGVRGVDAINAFTETMAGLSVATNLVGEKGATDLARFINIMGVSHNDIGRLGSAIVELGNNFATTESEILSMATEFAGTGATVKMTAQEVLGLATAMSAVGINAERGGSAISRVLIEMQKAAHMGGQRMRDFADISRKNMREFSHIIKTDPVEALNLFLRGIERLDRQGGNVFEAFERVGVSEIRTRDTIQRLFNAVDLFSDAIDKSNTGYAENVALSNEVARAHEPILAQFALMINNIKIIAKDIGDNYIPVWQKLIDGVNDATSAFKSLDSEQVTMIARWTALTTVITATVASVLLGIRAFFMLATVIPLVLRAGLFLLSPLAVSIALLATSFVAFFRAMDVQEFESILNKIGGAFDGVRAKVSGVADWLGNIGLKELWATEMDKLVTIMADPTLSARETTVQAGKLILGLTLDSFELIGRGIYGSFADLVRAQLNLSEDTTIEREHVIDFFKIKLKIAWEWFDGTILGGLANFLATNPAWQRFTTSAINLADINGDGDVNWLDVGALLKVGWDWILTPIESFRAFLSGQSDGEGSGASRLRGELQKLWNSEFGDVIAMSVMILLGWRFLQDVLFSAALRNFLALLGITTSALGWAFNLGRLLVTVLLGYKLLPEETKEQIKTRLKELAGLGNDEELRLNDTPKIVIALIGLGFDWAQSLLVSLKEFLQTDARWAAFKSSVFNAFDLDESGTLDSKDIQVGIRAVIGWVDNIADVMATFIATNKPTIDAFGAQLKGLLDWDGSGRLDLQDLITPFRLIPEWFSNPVTAFKEFLAGTEGGEGVGNLAAQLKTVWDSELGEALKYIGLVSLGFLLTGDVRQTFADAIKALFAGLGFTVSKGMWTKLLQVGVFALLVWDLLVSEDIKQSIRTFWQDVADQFKSIGESFGAEGILGAFGGVFQAMANMIESLQENEVLGIAITAAAVALALKFKTAFITGLLGWNIAANVLSVPVQFEVPFGNDHLRPLYEKLSTMEQGMSGTREDPILGTMGVWEVSAIDSVFLTIYGNWLGTMGLMKDAWKELQTFFTSDWEKLSEAWTKLTTVLKTAWETSTKFFIEPWENAINGLKAWEDYLRHLKYVWDDVTTPWINAWNAAIAGWIAMANAFRSSWETVLEALRVVWDASLSGIRVVWNAMFGSFNLMRADFQSSWERFTGDLAKAWKTFTDAVLAPWEATSEQMKSLKEAWDAYIQHLKQAWEAFKAWLTIWSNPFQALEDFWNATIGRLQATWTNFVNAVTGSFRSLFGGSTEVPQTQGSDPFGNRPNESLNPLAGILEGVRNLDQAQSDRDKIAQATGNAPLAQLVENLIQPVMEAPVRVLDGLVAQAPVLGQWTQTVVQSAEDLTEAFEDASEAVQRVVDFGFRLEHESTASIDRDPVNLMTSNPSVPPVPTDPDTGTPFTGVLSAMVNRIPQLGEYTLSMFTKLGQSVAALTGRVDIASPVLPSNVMPSPASLEATPSTAMSTQERQNLVLALRVFTSALLDQRQGRSYFDPRLAGILEFQESTLGTLGPIGQIMHPARNHMLRYGDPEKPRPWVDVANRLVAVNPNDRNTKFTGTDEDLSEAASWYMRIIAETLTNTRNANVVLNSNEFPAIPMIEFVTQKIEMLDQKLQAEGLSAGFNAGEFLLYAYVEGVAGALRAEDAFHKPNNNPHLAELIKRYREAAHMLGFTESPTDPISFGQLSRTPTSPLTAESLTEISNLHQPLDTLTSAIHELIDALLIRFISSDVLKGLHSGGIIPGYGGGDRFPALLEAGEAVIPAKVVRSGISGVVDWLMGQGVPRYSEGTPGAFVGLMNGTEDDGIMEYAKAMIEELEAITENTAENKTTFDRLTSFFGALERFMFGTLNGIERNLGKLSPALGESFGEFSILLSQLFDLLKPRPVPTGEDAETTNDDTGKPPVVIRGNFYEDIKKFLEQFFELESDRPEKLDYKMSPEERSGFSAFVERFWEAGDLFDTAITYKVRLDKAVELVKKGLEGLSNTLLASESHVSKFFGALAGSVKFQKELKHGDDLGDSISKSLDLQGTLNSLLNMGWMSILNMGVQMFQNSQKGLEERARIDSELADALQKISTMSPKQDFLPIKELLDNSRKIGTQEDGAKLRQEVAAVERRLTHVLYEAIYIFNEKTRQRHAAEIQAELDVAKAKFKEWSDLFEGADIKLREALGIMAKDFANAVSSAFKTADIGELRTNIREGVREALRGSMISRFLAENIEGQLIQMADLVFDRIKMGENVALRDLDSIIASISDEAEVFMRLLDELGLNASKVNNSFKEMTINAPEGYKVARTRFEAGVFNSDPEPDIVSPIRHNGVTVVISGNNIYGPHDLVAYLERAGVRLETEQRNMILSGSPVKGWA